MQPANPPDDEARRLAALHALDILDSPPEPAFDALVRAASLACGVPISLISLVDTERQWFKANTGLAGVTETARELAFCAHTVLGDALFEVADATQDPRFAHNPLVTGPPHIRFYAGAPVRLSDGHRVGTLCVIDRQPRQLSDNQREILQCLARAAAQAMAGRRDSLRLQQLAQDNVDQARRQYEATPAMLHSIDAQGRVLAVSDLWLAKLGYTRDAVLGRLSTDFLSPASLAYAREVVLPAFFATGRCDAVAYQLITHSGAPLDVLLSARLERDSNGQPLRSLAVSEDVTLRRQAERALLEERQRLANIIDGTDVGTWEWNVRTGEARINERFAQIAGRSLGEVGTPSIEIWRAALHPDDAPQLEALLRQHLAGKTPHYEAETRIRHSAGHWVWVKARGRVMTRTADGQPEWMFGIRWDISARKQQEAALRKSEQFLDRTGRVAGVGGWELDIASGVVTWSDETRRIHGVAADYQPVLAEAIHFYAPQARPVIEAAVAHGMASGQGWDLELPLIRADGRAIWVRVVGAVEFDGGQPARLVGAFQDITELHQSRAQLQRLNAELVTMLDNDMIGILRLQGRQVLWANRGMERIFGYASTDWLGMAADQLAAGDPAWQRLAREHAAALSDSTVMRSQLQLLRKDGSSVWIDASSVVMARADAGPADVMLLLTDITALKQTEEARIQAIALAAQNTQLRETGRLKDQFVANMSHELRTPLNAVIGYAHLLQSALSAPESTKLRGFAAQIGASGRHLLQLIENLLDYAQLESGKVSFVPVALDLSPLIDSVTAMLQADCTARQVQISVRVSPAVEHLHTDPARLKQVLLHLIGNAVKFSHTAGAVQVRALPDGAAHWRIEVQDHGIGIADADLPRLFTQFQQLSTGHSKTHDGAGLGLAMVRRAVESQGGSVGVTSQPGVGSVFFLRLPYQALG